MNASRSNPALNSVAEVCEFAESSREDMSQRFDDVVVNVDWATLCRLSVILSERFSLEGRLIVSRFVDNMAGDVREAFAACGLSVAARTTDDDWVCLVLSQPDSGS